MASLPTSSAVAMLVKPSPKVALGDIGATTQIRVGGVA